MNIYRITQDLNDGYDTYDAAVIVAATEEQARVTHPAGDCVWKENTGEWVEHREGGQDWISKGEWTEPKNVKVELIGETPGTTPGVILASFNAS